MGLYLGADKAGVARGEETYQRHWGGREQWTGFLRGTAKDTLDMVGAFRNLGCDRLNLAFREEPYDWDALAAFAETVLPAFGVKKPR